MNNIKKGDKIVYDNGHRKEYITVKAKDTLDTDKGSKITLINMRYPTTGLLREPTKEELATCDFSN